jgi:hypothetical protein
MLHTRLDWQTTGSRKKTPEKKGAHKHVPRFRNNVSSREETGGSIDLTATLEMELLSLSSPSLGICTIFLS